MERILARFGRERRERSVRRPFYPRQPCATPQTRHTPPRCDVALRSVRARAGEVAHLACDMRAQEAPGPSRAARRVTVAPPPAAAATAAVPQSTTAALNGAAVAETAAGDFYAPRWRTHFKVRTQAGGCSHGLPPARLSHPPGRRLRSRHLPRPRTGAGAGVRLGAVVRVARGAPAHRVGVRCQGVPPRCSLPRGPAAGTQAAVPQPLRCAVAHPTAPRPRPGQVRREFRLANAAGPHPNVLTVCALWQDPQHIYLAGARVPLAHASHTAAPASLPRGGLAELTAPTPRGAQEFAEQGDLIDLLRRHNGRVPEPFAAQIMLQVTMAACACAEREIVHRDIKLENVRAHTAALPPLAPFQPARPLSVRPAQACGAVAGATRACSSVRAQVVVSSDGVVKLMDFGLAIDIKNRKAVSRVGCAPPRLHVTWRRPSRRLERADAHRAARLACAGL